MGAGKVNHNPEIAGGDGQMPLGVGFPPTPSKHACCPRCVVLQGLSRPTVYSRSQAIVAQIVFCPVHHPRPTLETFSKEQ
jgi:hypothetical protein